MGSVERMSALRNTATRGPHDMGGLPAGPVDRAEHALEPWEQRVDAMRQIVHGKLKILGSDRLRRAQEALPPDAYHSMSYYERWLAAMASVLIENGVLTTRELGERIDAVSGRQKTIGKDPVRSGEA